MSAIQTAAARIPVGSHRSTCTASMHILSVNRLEDGLQPTNRNANATHLYITFARMPASETPLYPNSHPHESLRLPRISHATPTVTATLTSAATHNLTIPCASHASHAPQNPSPAPGAKSDTLVAASTKIVISAKTGRENQASMPYPDTQIPMAHPKNTTLQTLIPMELCTVTHNLTMPCAIPTACHDNRTSTPHSPHKVLCLPRQVLASTTIATSAKTCRENKASMSHPHTQVPMARPHPAPQTHDSPNANPNGAVYRDSQPHDSLRLPRIFPHPHVERAQSPAPATNCHLPRHTLTCKSQWHGHIQHPKHTTLQTLIPMELCTSAAQPHDSLRLPRIFPHPHVERA